MQKCYPGKLARQPCAAMPDKGFAVRDGPAARRLPMPRGTSPLHTQGGGEHSD